MAEQRSDKTRGDQSKGGDAKVDYEKHGWSEQSLKMLESEEGQLNAVFACYGSAAQHGQLFEDSLSRLLGLLNGLGGVDVPDPGLSKRTIGQLLQMFNTRFVVEIDDWVPKFLDKAKEQRNFLIHEYFLERSEEMGFTEGRFAILSELNGIEADLRRGTELVNGLHVAICKLQEGQRKDSGNGETVFSATLKVGEGEV